MALIGNACQDFSKADIMADKPLLTKSRRIILASFVALGCVALFLYASGVNEGSFLMEAAPRGVSEKVQPLTGSALLDYGIAEFNGTRSKYMRCRVDLPHSLVISRYAELLKDDNFLTNVLTSPDLSASQAVRAKRILAEGRDFVRVFTPRYAMLGYRDRAGHDVSIVAFAGGKGSTYYLSRTLGTGDARRTANVGLAFMGMNIPVADGMSIASSFRKLEGSPIAMFLLEGRRDKGELAAFYRETMLSAGWDVDDLQVAKLSAASEQSFLAFKRGDRRCYISIEQAKSGRSILTINFK